MELSITRLVKCITGDPYNQIRLKHFMLLKILWFFASCLLKLVSLASIYHVITPEQHLLKHNTASPELNIQR